jgi:hypothetical protein
MQLKRTAFYDIHRALGARIVEFGGFEMPVQYTGIIEEHRRVRESVGLFDVSHMGDVEHADRFADSPVLFDDARVLHGHFKTSELDDLGAERPVYVVERCSFQGHPSSDVVAALFVSVLREPAS